MVSRLQPSSAVGARSPRPSRCSRASVSSIVLVATALTRDGPSTPGEGMPHARVATGRGSPILVGSTATGGVDMPTIDELARELTALRVRVDASEGVLALQALKARYGELVDQRFSGGGIVDDARLA